MAITTTTTIKTTATTIYTSTGIESAGVSILFFNSNTTTETLKVYINTGSAVQCLEKEIPAKDTLIWEVKLLFASGNSIAASSTTDDKVNCFVSTLPM